MKFVVTYRKNPLLDRYIPLILASLERRGHEMKVLALPDSTPVAQAEQESFAFLLKEGQDEEPCCWMYDGTCYSELFWEERRKPGNRLKVSEHVGINNLFADSLMEALGGMGVEDQFRELFHRTLAAKAVKRVHIVSQCLADHTEVLKKDAEGFPDGHTYLASLITKVVAEFIKERTFVHETFLGTLKEVGWDPEALVVVDTHATAFDREYRKKNECQFFILPLSSQAWRLAEIGLLEDPFDPELMVNTIIEGLK